MGLLQSKVYTYHPPILHYIFFFAIHILLYTTHRPNLIPTFCPPHLNCISAGESSTRTSTSEKIGKGELCAGFLSQFVLRVSRSRACNPRTACASPYYFSAQTISSQQIMRRLLYSYLIDELCDRLQREFGFSVWGNCLVTLQQLKSLILDFFCAWCITSSARGYPATNETNPLISAIAHDSWQFLLLWKVGVTSPFAPMVVEKRLCVILLSPHAMPLQEIV